MSYLHFSLVENIFAFINRNEDRSDGLYPLRSYFAKKSGGFWVLTVMQSAFTGKWVLSVGSDGYKRLTLL